jgi:hypothetical protein
MPLAGQKPGVYITAEGRGRNDKMQLGRQQNTSHDLASLKLRMRRRGLH